MKINGFFSKTVRRRDEISNFLISSKVGKSIDNVDLIMVRCVMA